MSGNYIFPRREDFLALSGGTVTGNTDFTLNLSAKTIYSGSTDLSELILAAKTDISGKADLSGATFTGLISSPIISGNTFLSAGTSLEQIIIDLAGRKEDTTRVQPGTNINTGGTTNFPIVNLNDNINITSVSANTYYSGSTPLDQIFIPVGANLMHTVVSGGTNISTGGTELNPIINLDSDIVLNSVETVTISGGTIYSGGTDLSDIFLTQVEDSNTFSTGSTLVGDFLTTSRNDGNSFSVTVPLSTKTDLSGATFTGPIFAPTISGNTFVSGSTNLEQIILDLTGGAEDITRVQPGINIITGGTVNFPIVNLDDNINVISVSANTIYSGSTNLSNIIQNVSNASAAAIDLSNKYDKSGGTISGNVNILGDTVIQGDLTTIGSATTMATQIVRTKDNNIEVNFSGNHLTANGGGLTVISGKTDGSSTLWKIDALGNWNSNVDIYASAFSGGSVIVDNIFSGSTNLNDVFAPSIHAHSISDVIGLSSLLSTKTDLSGATFTGNVFAPTISGNTFVSGGTSLETIINNIASGFDTQDITRISGGTNISTGGTANNPIINLNNNVELNSAHITSLTGDTIYSGGTPLQSIIDNIIVTSTSDVTRIQPGTNITTGGTGNLPIINLANNINVTSVSADTIYSGSTDIGDIFLTESQLPSGTDLWSAGTGVNSILANNNDGLISSGLNSVAVGKDNLVSGDNSFVGGENSINTGDYSFIFGLDNIGSNNGIFVNGRDNIVTSLYGAAVGWSHIISGDSAVAFGRNNTAIGDQSFAVNHNNEAIGNDSVAMGMNTKANGDSSFSFGEWTRAVGNGSFVGGRAIATAFLTASGETAFNFSRTLLGYVGDGAAADYSVILGGVNQSIKSGAIGSAIFGGGSNTLLPSATNSIILGCTGVTASLSNTVYACNFTADTFYASHIFSGDTNLDELIIQSAIGAADVTRIQSGTNTNTGGTANFPIVNLDDDISLSSVSAVTISGDTIYSGSTDLYDIFITQVGDNTFSTGSTLVGNTLTTIRYDGGSFSSIIPLSTKADLSGATFSGPILVDTISGNTFVSGGTSLETIIENIALGVDTQDITRLQIGVNTFTGGTVNNPTVNITGGTFDNVNVTGQTALGKTSITSLSANTIFSGNTPLETIISDAIIDIDTFSTGSTLVGDALITNRNDGGIFSTIIPLSTKANLSGSTFTGSVFVPTISGNTFYSGNTPLDQIFQVSGADTEHTRVQNGVNIFTGGTNSNPTINIVNSPTFTGLVSASGFTDSSLTDTRMVFVGPGGRLIDDLGFTYNSTTNIMSIPDNGALIIGSGHTIIGSGGHIGKSGNGDLTVHGNLTVFGNSFSAHTEEMFVEDNNITLNWNPTASTISTSLGAGITIQDGSGTQGTDSFWDVYGPGEGTSTGAGVARSWATNMDDIRIRESGTTSNPTGVRLVAERDELDRGFF